MGPMNEEHIVSVEFAPMESLDSMMTASTINKFELPTDLLASTALVNATQHGLNSYICNTYNGQILCNNNTMNVTPVQSEEKETETIEQIRDDRLKQAAEEFQKSGSPLPLIKEQLWCKIQASRLAVGKPELKIQTQEKPKSYPLSPEEIQSRERRKENNRVSAKKCREKKKLQVKSIYDQHGELKKKNHELKKTIKELEALKSKYWYQVTTNCPVETLKSEDLYQHLPSDWELFPGDGA